MQPLFEGKRNKHYIIRMCVCRCRYPLCNAHESYNHLWLVPLYNFFPQKCHKRQDNNNEYSALGPVWAWTRAQSGDWHGSGTLYPGQVLRGSLPLISPKIKMWNASRFCVSSLRRGHVNHLCIVPIFSTYTAEGNILEKKLFSTK